MQNLCKNLKRKYFAIDLNVVQLKFAQAKHFEKNFSVCLWLRVKRSENLFQNQRSDAAGGVSIKALARQVTVKFKVRFFIG